MKYKSKTNTKKIDSHFLIYFLIILIVFNNLKCEDGPETCCITQEAECNKENCLACGGNYRYFYSGDETHKCVECSELSTLSESSYPYITLETEGDNNIVCKLKSVKQDEQKLIYDNKEIVSSCKEGYKYQLGDICYLQPFNTEGEFEQISSNEEYIEYKCKYFFYEEETNGFISKNCLESGVKCSNSEYYDDVTLQCFSSSCPSGKTFLKKESNEDEYIYRCSSQCKSTPESEIEYKYEETNNSGEVINTYCVDGDTCNTFLVKDIANNIIICLSISDTLSTCPPGYPYSYNTEEGKKFCLKTCKDTSHENFYYNEGYLFESSNECKNPDDVSDKKIDLNTFKFVDDCKNLPSGPYFSGRICTDNCGEKKLIYDTLECVDSCQCESCNYYELDNVCYTTCPRNSEKKYGKDGKCQKCITPNDPENPSDNNEKGFITNGKQICYESCQLIDNTKTFYYNNGENICYESSNGCKSNTIYKYSKYNDENKKCYKSCSDIGDDSYKYEYQYICYTQDNIDSISGLSDLFFYVNSTSGITKYISNSEEVAMRECFNHELKYLNGKECVQDCDHYKVLNTDSTFGICYADYVGCNNAEYKYHNSTNKICSKKCDSLIIEIPDDSTDDKANTCLIDCPDNYFQDKEKCKTSCEFYFEESGKVKCTDQCQYYKVDEGKKKCVDKCQKDGKYTFYLPSDGKCIDSCSEDLSPGLLYSYNTDEDHQPCISACPKEKGYLNYDEKNICQKTCPKYYLKIDENYSKCVDHCNNGSKVFPGNICKESTENCPNDAPFFFEEEILVEQGNPNSLITVTKCVSSCPENGYSLYQNSDKKCVESCPNDGLKLKFNGVCYSSCPEGLYENESGNECISKCPNYYKESDNKLICVSSCGDQKIVKSSKKCVEKCPIGENYFDGNYCLTSCKEFTNQFYQKIDENDGYPIYQCLKDITSCEGNTNNNKVSINGTKECISGCGKLYEYQGVCYDSCKSIQGASFSYGVADNGKECKGVCDSPYQYSGSDKICLDNCEQLGTNKTYDENTCVDKCNTNAGSVRKFLVKIDNKLMCKSSCDGEEKRFLKSNYICIEKCEFPNNYVVDNLETDETNNEILNECLSKCPDTKPYMRQNNLGEYVCSNKPCGEDGDNDEYELYYMDTKICLKECGKLYYYETEENNVIKKYCVNSCNYFKSVKLYHDESSTTAGDVTIYDYKCVENCKESSEENGNDRKYSKLNGFCGNNCEASDFYFDNEESDYVCLMECPAASMNEGQICTYCKDFSPKKYIDENSNCIDKCEDSLTGYIYHDEDENDLQCLNSCGNKKIKDNICVESCSGEKPYIKDNNCLDACPFTKRFFINNNSNNNNIMCLFDCPNDAKYYTITESEGKTYYKCQENCDAYVPKSSSNMNATFCFKDNKCEGDYPYFEKETIAGNEIKKCQAQCPTTSPYFLEELTENIECLEKCPYNTAHQPGSYICMAISKCTTKKIKIKDRECVEQCSKNEKIFTQNEISYCVDKCSDIPSEIYDSSLFSTYDNQCVTSCDPYTSEEKDGKCECLKLFYIDKSTLYKHCISDSDCSDNQKYSIHVFDTNECTDYCDGVLSLSGKECYPVTYECNKDSEKIIQYNNGDKICDCIDKYYYGSNDAKVCLNKGEQCHSEYNLLITETNECVNECKEPYKYQFENTCVSSCSSLKNIEEEEGNKCKCKYKYYVDNKNKVICLDENAACPDAYPLIIADDANNNQCVSSCPNGYEYYYQKTCKASCGNDLISVDNIGEDPSFPTQYAKKKCRCNNKWYYDDITMKEICSENTDDNCSTLNNSKFKYTIYKTNQCVLSCPSKYSFVFNNFCLEKCDDYTKQTILADSTNKKCVCQDYTEYIDNNNENIKCMTNCNSDTNEYSTVEEAKICYKKNGNKRCPNNYPYYYNGYCYSAEKCPSPITKPDPYEQKCACKYKWYKKEEDTLECLLETANCPPEYPLLIASTKECKAKNDEENKKYFEFNSTLYLSCPTNTVEDTRENGQKTCKCNPNKKWYSEQIGSYKYYYCAVKDCPEEKQYQNEDGKECLSKCEEGKREYKGICHQNCPNLTERGNNNDCVLSVVNDNIKLEDLEQTLTENVLGLYKSSDKNKKPTNSSTKIITKEATVEFYGVNMGNKGNKQDNIKSDLSYIDISECVEKIYTSHGMSSEADIIILKFDVTTTTQKMRYLVNPVEYKFINSLTGQELDASVCEHNSIKISYPLHDLIKRYDSMKKKRNLEYISLDLTSNNRDSLREKLDKGKEISQKYPTTDIFNINDKIYSDICIAVEVDGKDLTLIDRINYFYPQIAICENNCTYNHTDFVNERIYCDCSFKKEFDFKRNDDVLSFELNTDQINNDQGGNSNIAVLKCISNLNNSKSLSGNGGFIFILIVVVVEVILFFIIILYGINSILNKLNNKMKNEEENDENENGDDNGIEVVSVDNTNPNEKKEKETERQLNAPPKKKGEFGMEFIPQEYVFLFFNQNEKGVIKKVERDSVPFKVAYNTRILLEKNKNVNYNNIKSRGPYPPNQNVLVIVDNMNDDIFDYIYDEDEEKHGRKNSEQNNINEGNDKERKNKNGEIISEKYGKNAKTYSKRKFEFTTSDYDPSDENYSDIDFDEDENHEKGIIESIKKEQRLLKKDYETALQNQKSSNFVIMLLTEIVDKIYFTKIILFTRKFDIISLQFSVYFLCHTILLIFLALFYDIKTITKIWNTENYPGLGFHLLYGFLACIIVWIIYKIILCLWNNNDKIKEILRLIHAYKKYGVNNQKLYDKKCNNLAWKIKLKIAIYTVIQFLLLAFCFIYFVTFCTVYTGTKTKVFQSYGIALIEILIIKILYAIALAVLRKVSLTKEKKILYEIVLFMNTYIV